MAAIANFLHSLVLPSTIASPSASAPAPAVSMTSPSRCSPSPNFPHQKGFAPLVLSVTARDGDRDISWVANPSLAHATTLFFKSSHYNVQITVDDNESEERLVNRFRREVIRAGIIRECKRRRFFETSQEYHKRKTREAAWKRSRLGDTARYLDCFDRRPQVKLSQQQQKKMMKKERPTPKTKRVENEEDDNWELPEGELPLPY